MEKTSSTLNIDGRGADRRARLLIVTTVPSTLASILRDQPKFLSQHYEIHLACSSGGAVQVVTANEEVPVHQVEMQRGISAGADLISLFRMIVLLRKIRPNAIHSYTPKAGLISMLAGWMCGVPLRIHTFTGLIFPTAIGMRRLVLIWMDRLICGCATHIVPEGNGVKKDLERARITKKELTVIGHGNVAGVDIERFHHEGNEQLLDQASDLKGRLGIVGGDFIFLFIGRLNRDKGIYELLTAFQRLPNNAKLILVGAFDSTLPISPESLKEIHESSRIMWVGPQSDVRPALMIADVLVLPSYREGFPNVVLEAGAMTVPVIATDINGSNEAITHGINGWLVPIRDAIALHDAMVQAMNTSKEQLHEMGLDARDRIVSRFERKGHLERMLRYYRTIFSSRN